MNTIKCIPSEKEVFCNNKFIVLGDGFLVNYGLMLTSFVPYVLQPYPTDSIFHTGKNNMEHYYQ